MKRSAFVVFALAVAAGVGALLVACSDDKPPAGGGGVTDASSGVDVSRPDAEADAADSAPPVDLCPSPPAQTAPVTQDMFVAGDRPAALGGAIKPGTYHLVRSESYTGAGGRSGPVGTIIKRTTVFTDELMVYSEEEGTIDGGIDEGDTQGKKYAANGNVLTLINSCSSGAGTFPSGNIQFSVVGDQIHLLTSATQREVLVPPGTDAGF
jgi:hypothetical protein